MSYKTVEVELDSGRVWPRGVELLPAKATALLTILEPHNDTTSVKVPSVAGLRRFLSASDFPLTAEQFRASMDADFYEQ